MEKKYHRISNADFFRICSWIKENKERLQSERPTQPATCRMILQEIAIQCSPKTIHDACGATGVVWETKIAYGHVSSIAIAMSKITVLEARVAALEKLLDVRVAALEKSLDVRVAALEKSMGGIRP